MFSLTEEQEMAKKDLNQYQYLCHFIDRYKEKLGIGSNASKL